MCFPSLASMCTLVLQPYILYFLINRYFLTDIPLIYLIQATKLITVIVRLRMLA